MSVPVSMHRPSRPLAFERIQYALSLPCGDDFTTARLLIGLIEQTAGSLSELDRQQIARLMTSTGHSIQLTCQNKRY
jgi:hypothetical protein